MSSLVKDTSEADGYAGMRGEISFRKEFTALYDMAGTEEGNKRLGMGAAIGYRPDSYEDHWQTRRKREWRVPARGRITLDPAEPNEKEKDEQNKEIEERSEVHRGGSFL